DIKAAQQKKTQELFEKLRDGKVKPDEMRQASEKIRDEVLKDMKDVLTKEQYEKFEKAFKAGPGGPGGPGGFPGGPGGPGGRPAFGPGQLYARTILTKADADKDGKVTLEEFVKACEAFFKDADKNKDGFLDEKELTDGLSSLMPGPGGPGGPRPGGP